MFVFYVRLRLSLDNKFLSFHDFGHKAAKSMTRLLQPMCAVGGILTPTMRGDARIDCLFFHGKDCVCLPPRLAIQLPQCCDYTR